LVIMTAEEGVSTLDESEHLHACAALEKAAW
jgi:hypothetical protein